MAACAVDAKEPEQAGREARTLTMAAFSDHRMTPCSWPPTSAATTWPAAVPRPGAGLGHAGPVHDPATATPSSSGAPVGPSAERTWGPPAGNPADPRYWQRVDEAYGRALEVERARDPHPWLLEQTVVTGVPRRALYGALGLRPGCRVLDAGTGFAPVAVELAGAFGCRVVGVDAELSPLGSAGAVVDDLVATGWLGRSPGPTGGAPASRALATVALAAGLVTVLPFAEATFDAVVARFLLQHLPDVPAAVAELVRVTRPGGVVCVIDADDGLSLRYPESPEPLRRLEEAYQRAQEQRGGDRAVGRKVAGLLDGAGVDVQHVLVLPQAAYGPLPAAGPGRQLLHDRLAAFADELVARGLLDAAAVDDGLQVLRSGDLPAATAVDMHLAVIGRRRPPG